MTGQASLRQVKRDGPDATGKRAIMDANSKPEVEEGDPAFIAVDGVKVIKYSEHGSTAAEAGWRIERVTLQDTDAFWPALQELSYNDAPLNWLIASTPG